MTMANLRPKSFLKMPNFYARLPNVRFWELAKDAFRRRAIYRRALAELHALSARELKDMRITHTDIRRLAREVSMRK